MNKLLYIVMIIAVMFGIACTPTPTPKYIICHWDNGQGGKWTSNTVAWESIANLPNGHAYHANDIIPAIPEHSYTGKNLATVWDGYTGQQILANGCKIPVPTLTNTATATPTDTATYTPVPPTDTPTDTLVPPTATPTDTLVPPTATPTPTDTLIPPTETPVPPTPTGTWVPTPTATQPPWVPPPAMWLQLWICSDGSLCFNGIVRPGPDGGCFIYDLNGDVIPTSAAAQYCDPVLPAPGYTLAYSGWVTLKYGGHQQCWGPQTILGCEGDIKLWLINLTHGWHLAYQWFFPGYGGH